MFNIILILIGLSAAFLLIKFILETIFNFSLAILKIIGKNLPTILGILAIYTLFRYRENLIVFYQIHQQSINATLIISIKILLIIFILVQIVRFFQKRVFIKWLENTGFSPLECAPSNKSIHQWAAAQNHALIIEPNYILSIKFHDSLTEEIRQQQIITLPVVQNIILQKAPAFQEAYILSLLIYLESCKEISSFTINGGNIYIHQQLMQNFISLLEKKGAVTVDEFWQFCPELRSTSYLPYPTLQRELAKKILQNMVNSHLAHIAGHDLYIANHRSANCEMIRKEISLDD